MSDEKKGIPALGQTVWVKMTCVRHDLDYVLPWLGQTVSDQHRHWVHVDAEWLPDPLPAATPRQPWETLREAAGILEQRGGFHTERLVRKYADDMEREAAPPDPLDVLRRIVAHTESFHGATRTGTGQQLYEEARRCLAAHDKKEGA